MAKMYNNLFTVFIIISTIWAVSALVLDDRPSAVPPTLPSVTDATSPITSVCQNTINSCSDYGRQMCTTKVYQAWVRSHCSMYCGFCTPKVVDPKECEDRVPNCNEYDSGDLCTSSKYYSWAYDNCKRYCKLGVCYEKRTTAGPSTAPIPTTTEGVEVCRNNITTCSHYGRQMCTRDVYQAWVNSHCALYCGKCTPKVLNPTECDDKVPNCNEFDDGTLCKSSAYYAWAYDNCRGYCRMGLCTVPGGPPKTTASSG